MKCLNVGVHSNVKGQIVIATLDNQNYVTRLHDGVEIRIVYLVAEKDSRIVLYVVERSIFFVSRTTSVVAGGENAVRMAAWISSSGAFAAWRAKIFKIS